MPRRPGIAAKCLITGRLVGYSSGQRGQTVNLLAYAYEGSNPSPTTTPKPQETPVSANKGKAMLACQGLPCRSTLPGPSLIFVTGTHPKSTPSHPRLEK